MFKQLPELQKQVIKFTLIGLVAVFTDLSVYYVLLNVLPQTNHVYLTLEVVAKTGGFLSGTFVTYNLNKLWTWRRKDRSSKRLVKFFALYGSSMLLNVATNSLVLFLLHSNADQFPIPHTYVVAFVMATGMSAIFNFLGQKLWVFAVKKQQS